MKLYKTVSLPWTVVSDTPMKIPTSRAMVIPGISLESQVKAKALCGLSTVLKTSFF